MELAVQMFAPQETPFTEADFSNDELREGWIAYKRAIAVIEDKLQNHGFTSPGWQKLIDQHRDRMATLEQAQRVLNSHRLSQRL